MIAAGEVAGNRTEVTARADKHVINRRVIEALVRAGALDRLLDDRATLLATVGRAIDAAQHEAASAGQASLFGAPDGAKRHVEYGAKPAHYPVVGEALLWTLEKGLGDSWTPQVAEAWTQAYTTLSGFMIGEAYGQKAA